MTFSDPGSPWRSPIGIRHIARKHVQAVPSVDLAMSVVEERGGNPWWPGALRLSVSGTDCAPSSTGAVHELMEIPVSTGSDPRGERLAAVFNAHIRAERWAVRRAFVGWIVIVVSLPMSCFVFRGMGLESAGARLTLAVWLLALVSLVACVVASAQAHRLVDALLHRAEGRRIQIDD